MPTPKMHDRIRSMAPKLLGCAFCAECRFRLYMRSVIFFWLPLCGFVTCLGLAFEPAACPRARGESGSLTPRMAGGLGLLQPEHAELPPPRRCMPSRELDVRLAHASVEGTNPRSDASLLWRLWVSHPTSLHIPDRGCKCKTCLTHTRKQTRSNSL